MKLITDLPLAARITARELRGGLSGFRVFLLCLALGVAAIAAVGSVRLSIQQGLAAEGATILGGDAQMAFTYRFATPQERAYMEDIAVKVSETVDFRSMLLHDANGSLERGLTQVRVVDSAYPLIGQVQLVPDISIEEALSDNGIIIEQLLIDRMGLQIGETVRLGDSQLVLRAAIERLPDAAAGGFGLGPRSVVHFNSLKESGLLVAGTLFDSEYRLLLPQTTLLSEARADALRRFSDSGLRWRDARNAAPGIATFVERIGSFLVLVGLAGLAVGGMGVSAAVQSYMARKAKVIATLKTLGAEKHLLYMIYGLQIGALALVGISAGLILGAFAPWALSRFIEAHLPVALSVTPMAAPLIEAALYGALTAAIFTIAPLSKLSDLKAATLYRDAQSKSRLLPRGLALGCIIGLTLLLVWLAAWFSGVPRLAYLAAGGILGALAALTVVALGLGALSRYLARSPVLRGNVALRSAFAAIGARGGGAITVVLSLGLGLTVLAAVGQVDANLRAAIERDLPDVAPSYFFVDIQNNQLDDFLKRLDNDAAVSRVDHAPMLRGVITRINDRPAREVAGNHWVVRGDRGISYAKTPPPNTTILAGEWWDPDHTGPAQISFAEEEALEMGIGLGDTITVNILGRDITGTITSLREVDFSTASMGFIMIMSPNALAGAPHSHIATVYADEDAEAQILRDVTQTAPNITAIRVRDAIELVSEALSGLAAATSLGAGAALLTGFVVLIGAAAAGERGRVFEAAVLKTLGATRLQILWSFALRSMILGAAAGAVAICSGVIAGWSIMQFVLSTPYAFEPVSAFAIVIGGALASLLAGLAFALKPLGRSPASVLRSPE